ncbi:hypothetical protein MOTT12_01521 [Mycobacterium intracellulare subsp. yongonense]|nr:hypothetical protein MOTT12_01521 [Mycobacterium intracellulare subsp. yongonense]
MRICAVGSAAPVDHDGAQFQCLAVDGVAVRDPARRRCR